MRACTISSNQSVSRQPCAWKRSQRHGKRSDRFIETESQAVTTDQETLAAETGLFNRHQERFCGASTDSTIDLSMAADVKAKGMGRTRTRRREYVEITWIEVMTAMFTTGIIVFLLSI